MRRSLLMLALLAGAGCLRAGEAPPRSAAQVMDILMWNREPVGGPFALVDQAGKRRTDADFRGKLMLVYFGYTYCPDICPTDLQQMGLAVKELGAAGSQVQPLFITLDPERDTAKHLAVYVPSFHPRFVGLTGTPAMIGHAADAYKVYFQKVQAPGQVGYTVDHTAFIYLMDRQGRYLGFFPPGTPAERMVEVIRLHLR